MENYLKISLIKKLNRKYLSDEVYHLPKEILLFQNSILKLNDLNTIMKFNNIRLKDFQNKNLFPSETALNNTMKQQ